MAPLIHDDIRRWHIVDCHLTQWILEEIPDIGVQVLLLCTGNGVVAAAAGTDEIRASPDRLHYGKDGRQVDELDPFRVMELRPEGVAGMAPVGPLEWNVRHLLRHDAGSTRLGAFKLFGTERIADGNEPVPMEDRCCSFDFRRIEDFDIEHGGSAAL